MNKTILIIIVILVVVGGYFLLKGGYKAPASELNPNIPEVKESKETPKAAVSTQGETDVKEMIVEAPSLDVSEVTIVGTEFAFNPSSITIEEGETIRLTFRNEGNYPHDFVIDGLNVQTSIISGGNSETIEFTAPASGSYTFFCSVGSHRSRGMEGNLNVE